MVVLTAKASSGEFTLLEPGSYLATLQQVDYEIKPNTFARREDIESGKEPENIEQFVWTWLVDPGEEGVPHAKLRSWSGASVHPTKSKCGSQILPALGIRVPEDGEEFDTDDWRGECMVQVIQERGKRDETKLYNKIVGYSSVPKVLKKKLF